MPLLPAVVLLGVAPAPCVCSEVRANGARAVATAVCVASAALLGVARTEVVKSIAKWLSLGVHVSYVQGGESEGKRPKPTQLGG